MNRNIDSYRFNPHFNGIMANTQYLQRIEDDNTIQNNTEKDCCQDKNSEKSSENLNKDFSEKINDIKEQSSFDNNLLDEKNA